jgi:bifunctional enzyme CysN/CysC
MTVEKENKNLKNSNNLDDVFLKASRIEKQKSTVIWLTGYSGAGKTTVGRKVESFIKEKGVNSVFLDGDDLRGIFSGKWGFERDDRIQLAHAYFKLCNTLASQGITVIISAVAMYDEIYSWVRKNVDHSLIIYLEVPEQERIARDLSTKNIYKKMGDVSKLYEVPNSPDIVIQNYGENSPDDSVDLIINAYRDKVGTNSKDKGRTVHWDDYYSSMSVTVKPSSFALYCSELIKQKSALLEIGCGNGRDSAYFSKVGHKVTAIDPSSSAIELCKRNDQTSDIDYISCKLPDFGDTFNDSFDVIYSRFCLHAMTEEEEIQTLIYAYNYLKLNGNFFIECRSINDPLARKGEFLSTTERCFGHYRRFIIQDDLKKRLEEIGFVVNTIYESDNLASMNDDNPVVIRVQASKN